MMKKLQIHVSRSDISMGERCSSYASPLAQSFIRRGYTPMIGDTRFSLLNRGKIYSYQLPEVAQEHEKAFDRGKRIPSYRFTVEIDL